MPEFFPRRLREYNQCHEPGGRPEGGRFAKSNGPGNCGPGGAPQSTATTGAKPQPVAAKDPAPAPQAVQTTGDPVQKKLFPPDQMAKFNERPQRPPRGFKEEPPEPKPDPGDHTADAVSSYHDDGDVDEVLSALGISLTGEELAEAMTSKVTGVTFSVSAETSDVERDGEDTSNSPDPESARDDYNEWLENAHSEAEDALYNEHQDTFDRYSENSFFEVGTNLNEVLGNEQSGATVVPYVSSNDRPLTDADLEAKAHTEALAELIFKDTDIITEEGMLERRWEHRVGEVALAYLADNPGATFMAFPEREADADWWLDARTRRGFSKYFNDDDGRDEWLNDSMNAGAGDDLDSFETWYEGQYGHSPDDYGNSGDITSGKVELRFSGSDGTTITRSFYMEDGELHVHHDFFRAGKAGEGLARQLFQGSLPVYDQLGVGAISTLANLDVGGYTWARFGFEQTGSVSAAMRELKDNAQRMFDGFFSDDDWKAFNTLASNTSDNRALWRIADLKMSEDPSRIAAYVERWSRRVGPRADAADVKFNELLKSDAERGIVNIGRILMANEDFGWSAQLRLDDDDQVARLMAYTGNWRRPGRGTSAVGRLSRQERREKAERAAAAAEEQRQLALKQTGMSLGGGRSAIYDALARTPEGDRSFARQAVDRRVEKVRANMYRPVPPIADVRPRLSKGSFLRDQQHPQNTRAAKNLPGYRGSRMELLKKLGKRRLKY